METTNEIKETLSKNKHELSRKYKIRRLGLFGFDAVIRHFEIIGEAGNLLPDELEEKYHAINWHRIVGLRNRLIHGYFGVDPSIVSKSFNMTFLR